MLSQSCWKALCYIQFVFSRSIPTDGFQVIYRFPSFPDRPYCIHCEQFQTMDISQILEHCKTCVKMTRPNINRHEYVCYACSYCTTKTHNIKRHVYTHLGDKPYGCPYCDFRCVEKGTLMNHIERHQYSSDLTTVTVERVRNL